MGEGYTQRGTQRRHGGTTGAVDIGRIVREVEMIPEAEPDRAPLEEPDPAREPVESRAT